MTLPTTLDLDDLERRIREACDLAGEPIYAIDRSLDYQLDIWGNEGWSLAVGNPHHPPQSPHITLRGRRAFHGKLTAGAWAALNVVDRFLSKLPNDQRY